MSRAGIHTVFTTLSTHLYLHTNQYHVHMLNYMDLSFWEANPLCTPRFTPLHCLQNTGTMKNKGHGTKLSVTIAYVYKNEVACFILHV